MRIFYCSKNDQHDQREIIQGIRGISSVCMKFSRLFVMGLCPKRRPDTPKLPTGKAAHADLEYIDKHLYKPNAKMVSFRIVDKTRLMNWLK